MPKQEEKKGEKKAKALPNGTIIRSPDGAVYVIEAGFRRLVPDRSTYIRMGINADYIVELKEEQIEAIPEGTPFPKIGPKKRK